MKAQDRLHAAHISALEGNHAAALAEYVWFHEHALAEEPSLYGVRLSFALAYWKALADVYPPAYKALCEIRTHTMRRLLDGELDRDLFHDIEAINQYLNESLETVKLFELLDHDHPEFAQDCGGLALEALVEAGRFQLAAKHIPDHIARVIALAERLNSEIALIPERPRSKNPLYRAHVWNFAQDLRTILAILSGADRHTEVDECLGKANSILKPWYVRKAVERALPSKA